MSTDSPAPAEDGWVSSDPLKGARRVDAKLRTRFQIRTAAVELFREQGFNNVTTEQIAARVGVTQRTLFRHFRTKDAILFDDDSLVEYFDTALGRHLDLHEPIEALRLTLRNMGESYDRNAPLFRAHHEVIIQSAMLGAFARQRTARIDDLVALGLDGRNAFLARSGRPSLASRAAAGLIMGALRVITDEWLEGKIPGAMVDLCDRAWPGLETVLRPGLRLVPDMVIPSFSELGQAPESEVGQGASWTLKPDNLPRQT